MNKYIFNTILLFFLIVPFNWVMAQTPIRHTYRFYNTLSTTELDCGPDLTPVKGLNLECQPSTAATSGSFISDNLPLAGINRTVYHNNLNWGLRYANTEGVIEKTYTVQLYLRVTNFNSYYTRIIDFSNGVADDGIYFTNYNTPPPATNRCLNFYPNGNFGVCPFFDSNTWYLLTFTRNDLTKKIDIYVNDQLFTSYNDSADFYVGTKGKPVHIFRDDPVGFACEDGEANFAYLSFTNFYSTQSDVSLVYNNINASANTADFSFTPVTTCIGQNILVNYNGNIPSNDTSYAFTWNWDGGNVISGGGRGPFTISWNAAGSKNITLNITGGACLNTITNIKQISLVDTVKSEADTTICFGSTYEGYAASGTYVQYFKTASGCDSTRTIKLTVSPALNPNLGSINNLCSGESIVLSPGNYDSYLWQDGSTQNIYTVKNAGAYSVTVANKCGTANAAIQISEANCKLYFPSAFSPNKDGLNETFKISTLSNLFEYYLAVYNRYGQKIFETKKPSTGWDGNFNGNVVQPGVYIWFCNYKKTSAEPVKILKGTVVLIR
ncbi:MAG: gliding motility-associated C-terminal domain-containing protein [Ferruginibacter sp.]